MSAWVKLYVDIFGDPKLMRATRNGATSLYLLPWIIAFAKLADDEGRLTVNGDPAEAEDIAYGIPNIDAPAVAACLSELQTLGVLAPDSDHPNVLFFVAWERRNAKPSDSKEAVKDRVKKHRAGRVAKRKQKAALQRVTPSNANRGVTDVTPCNAECNAECNATDSDLDRDLDRGKNSAPYGAESSSPSDHRSTAGAPAPEGARPARTLRVHTGIEPIGEIVKRVASDG